MPQILQRYHVGSRVDGPPQVTDMNEEKLNSLGTPEFLFYPGQFSFKIVL